MAYEFLKKLFGTPKEGEQPKAMTAEELEAAIDAAEDLTLINLAGGGYVPQADLDAKATELAGIRKQLDDANTTIQSYKDMDIDGIKQSAADWETRYNTDTQELQNKLVAQAYKHAVEMAAAGIGNFSSNGARKAFIADLTEKGLKLENGKLLGLDDFLTEYKKNDPGAFIADTPPDDPEGGGQPYFSGPTGGAGKPGGKKMSLLEKMKWANAHPGEKVSFD